MTQRWQSRYLEEFQKRPARTAGKAKPKPPRTPRPDPQPELPTIGQRVSVPLAHNETVTGRVLAVYPPDGNLPMGMIQVVGRNGELKGYWSMALSPRDLERVGADEWRFKRGA